MRPIDADALKIKIQKIKAEALEHGFAPESICGDILLNFLDNAPTIEATGFVYCKDCKYNVANSKHEPLDITDYTDITCEYFMTDGMSSNDFCSQGVKIPVISMEDVPKLAKD